MSKLRVSLPHPLRLQSPPQQLRLQSPPQQRLQNQCRRLRLRLSHLANASMQRVRMAKCAAAIVISPLGTAWPKALTRSHVEEARCAQTQTTVAPQMLASWHTCEE